MGRNKIVSVDFDLTLFEHDTRRITPSALEAIEKLRPDYFIVLASGRDMYTAGMRNYLNQINPDAVIHANGARISIGTKEIRDYFWPKELLEAVIQTVRDKGWCIGANRRDYEIKLT
ncbi:MAG: HAD hydrolase family protein [Dorea sp.]|jgi:hydroxymethylpyrimidine pyrophosphatase-like HAD family hydrolase|nr:HAD hydrolase family protein [Dorea sp.]